MSAALREALLDESIYLPVEARILDVRALTKLEKLFRI